MKFTFVFRYSNGFWYTDDPKDTIDEVRISAHKKASWILGMCLSMDGEVLERYVNHHCQEGSSFNHVEIDPPCDFSIKKALEHKAAQNAIENPPPKVGDAVYLASGGWLGFVLKISPSGRTVYFGGKDQTDVSPKILKKAIREEHGWYHNLMGVKFRSPTGEAQG